MFLNFLKKNANVVNPINPKSIFNFDKKPYPHLTYENFLDEKLHSDILKFWPDDKLFYDEIPGIRLFDLVNHTSNIKNNEAKKFWCDFKKDIILKINQKIYDIFKENIENKFNKKRIPDLCQFNLMQATTGFKNHAVHSHHYHNPNWAYTMLLYIDDGGIGADGTDIYKPAEEHNLSNSLDYAMFSLKYIYGGDEESFNSTLKDYKLIRTKQVKFKNNKLFAFFETPFSYHGVSDPTKTDIGYKMGQRKIIRLHAGYDESFIKDYYGFDKKTYELKRRQCGEFPVTNMKNTYLKNIDKSILKKIKNECELVL